MNCKAHDRYLCPDAECKNDNLGKPSINTDGGMSIGVGNGLTIDPSDGSLGIQIAPGISLDF